MSIPSQTCFSVPVYYIHNSSSISDVFIPQFIPQWDTRDPSEHPHFCALQQLFICLSHCPRFPSIKHNWSYHHLVDFGFKTDWHFPIWNNTRYFLPFAPRCFNPIFYAVFTSSSYIDDTTKLIARRCSKHYQLYFSILSCLAHPNSRNAYPFYTSLLFIIIIITQLVTRHKSIIVKWRIAGTDGLPWWSMVTQPSTNNRILCVQCMCMRMRACVYCFVRYLISRPILVTSYFFASYHRRHFKAQSVSCNATQTV
jgi:hypothetical protein